MGMPQSPPEYSYQNYTVGIHPPGPPDTFLIDSKQTLTLGVALTN